MFLRLFWLVDVGNRVFTTAAKSGKWKRYPSSVRERCIGFIKILRSMGYDKTIALGEAFELFRSEVGIVDSKSLRAYFGTRAGKSKRVINMRKQYQNGEQSFRINSTLLHLSDLTNKTIFFRFIKFFEYS